MQHESQCQPLVNIPAKLKKPRETQKKAHTFSEVPDLGSNIVYKYIL